MKKNQIDSIKDRLGPNQLVALYATERLVSALEKFSETFSNILTNPLGIGSYLKLLPGKDNPLSYLVPVNILFVVTYYIATLYGTELAGYLSLSFAFIVNVIFLVVEYLER